LRKAVVQNSLNISNLFSVKALPKSYEEILCFTRCLLVKTILPKPFVLLFNPQPILVFIIICGHTFNQLALELEHGGVGTSIAQFEKLMGLGVPVLESQRHHHHPPMGPKGDLSLANKGGLSWEGRAPFVCVQAALQRERGKRRDG
jgi:hypothetical protein